MSATQTVKYKAGKQVFEILVTPGSVPKWRDGKLGIDKVLVADIVFKNHSKGEQAKGSDLKAIFDTEDVNECMKIILEKGDVPVTASERKEKVEKKRNEIVNYFHKYFIDSRSKLPHPTTRIENALDEIRFHPDPDIPFEKQVPDVLKKLIDIMPLKRVEMDATITVEHKYSGMINGIVHKYSKVRNEKYGKNCMLEISVLPGDLDYLVKELAKITNGEFDLSIDGKDYKAIKDEQASASNSGGKGKKGGRGGGGRGGKGKGRKK